MGDDDDRVVALHAAVKAKDSAEVAKLAAAGVDVDSPGRKVG